MTDCQKPLTETKDAIYALVTGGVSRGHRRLDLERCSQSVTGRERLL
uniref:Uncharacterized protein n=1 Tax=Candidatus Kentrum sp. TC TaxID=2126339 RepID=A0A451AFF6_9GAMM|nr:MAG: hypothetical protein BECKTC1821F_GA0114240_11452 [Candidatus Kentron sp. TC]